MRAPSPLPLSGRPDARLRGLDAALIEATRSAADCHHARSAAVAAAASHAPTSTRRGLPEPVTKPILVDLGACTLVLAGVAAELNLLRMLWREQRGGGRRAPRRSLRLAAPAGALLGAAALLTPAAAQGADWNASITFWSQPEAPRAEPSPTIAADRPGFSDTTSIAPVGRLQLETGYTFTFRNRDGSETQRHNAPEIVARMGVLDDRLEVRVVTSGYVWSRTDDGSGGGFQGAEGFSDALVGVKVKLNDQDGALPRIALEALTTVGTGSRGISNRDVEPTVKFIWSYDLGTALGDSWKGFGAFGNLNLTYASTSGDRFLQGAASFGASYAITSSTSVFAEYFVVGPNAKGADAAHSFDFGGAYLLTNRIQLDARVGFGLNQEADNLFAGVGVSFLF